MGTHFKHLDKTSPKTTTTIFEEIRNILGNNCIQDFIFEGILSDMRSEIKFYGSVQVKRDFLIYI